MKLDRILHHLEDHKKLLIWFVTQATLVVAFVMEQSGATYDTLCLWSVTLAGTFAGLRTIENVKAGKTDGPKQPPAPLP